MSILVINGPNLNNLGTRDPEIYGSTTLREIEDLMAQYGDVRGLTLEFFQSNHEGSIVDLLQEKGPSSQGIIINPCLLYASPRPRDVEESGKAACG